MTESEWRRLKVQHHLCLDCGKQDAFTLGGHTYCFECNDKRNAKARERRAADTETSRAYSREVHARLKDDGRCTMCCKLLGYMDAGHSLCFRCRAQQRNRYHSRKVLRRVGNICWQCCQAEPIPGKKLCAECYGKNLEKLVDARAERDRETMRRRAHG